MQHYWDRHPFQYEVFCVLREGQWVSHVFEWVFMMISRFSGYVMTVAVGYLILYAIESRHGLDAVSVHPTFPDQLAIFSNVVINVGPELVFPGVVVLCIKSFTARRWIDGSAYLITTIVFAALTMVLLNAFMNNGIDKNFLATMLFWRAGAALFYTVVVAYCGGHGGLDLRSLLNELDTLRTQVDGGQQQASSLHGELERVQQHASTLQQHVERGQQQASSLRGQLEAERQRAADLEAELTTHSTLVASLQKEIRAGHAEVERVLAQATGKQQKITELHAMLEHGQEWQTSEFGRLLDAERKKTATLQERITEQELAEVALRREIHEARVESETVRGQLQAKVQEIESVRTLLKQKEQRTRQGQESQPRSLSNTPLATGQHHHVSTLQPEVDGGEQGLSTQQVNSGQADVDGGEHRVIRLDANRTRKGGQEMSAIGERIVEVLSSEPELSDRKIADRLKCSPTTVGNWRKIFEQERALSRA